MSKYKTSKAGPKRRRVMSCRIITLSSFRETLRPSSTQFSSTLPTPDETTFKIRFFKSPPPGKLPLNGVALFVEHDLDSTNLHVHELPKHVQ